MRLKGPGETTVDWLRNSKDLSKQILLYIWTHIMAYNY